MCHFSFYPDPSGEVIAALKAGDEITLEPGFGRPSAKVETTKVVARVHDFSAICTDGTLLMCNDGWGVKATGNKKSVGFAPRVLSKVPRRLVPMSAKILQRLAGAS